MRMGKLETGRLSVRPFGMQDLERVHQILDVELGEVEPGDGGVKSLARRKEWLHWSSLNYEQLARLYQPPYGDRAVVLRETGELVGATGFVPSLGPFGQLPSSGGVASRFTTEFGLYYAIAPAHRGRGYASEAARALVDFAFEILRVERIVATTSYDNAASMGVMCKLGMRVERNPLGEPPWFQVVGILEYALG